jgi:hypothetical protein
MKRAYYSDTIQKFIELTPDELIGKMSMNNEFTLLQTQRDAWLQEIEILKQIISVYSGAIYFEYTIPRMGQRIDVVLIIRSVIFVLEFKIGDKDFYQYGIDQVWDYALDLKSFHDTSHDQYIAPILIATKAKVEFPIICFTSHNDKVFLPIKTNVKTLEETIDNVLNMTEGADINSSNWEEGKYHPTPTIIEAAMSLYNGHSVADISRSDAGAINLSDTSEAISEIILTSRENSQKSICFVTGVPGAGKTLVGLNIATSHNEIESDLHSVFLSGNGPLVAILREALTRDKVKRAKENGAKITKGTVMSEVKLFVQNVHNFRDSCLVDNSPQIEHVTIFDEAQRAWDIQKTSDFMNRKKHVPDFNQSEPDFLISCLDRHPDWAVIICLVGGGQEINTGEAGISEWINCLIRSYPKWHIYVSERLTDSEYDAGKVLIKLKSRPSVVYKKELHLSVSLRSFRAENVSLLIKQILDIESESARETYYSLNKNYPIVLTRDLTKAKQWLKEQARGTERYGIVVSSQAYRLKPHAIDVKSPIDPINWFLNDKDDVRSSYYLEDVATEFHIQGLELDWACITWDGDFRYKDGAWDKWSFEGSRWKKIIKPERQMYLKNAYRVLLTRARQGMVIVVPYGDENDHTRKPEFYDSTYEYLKGIGFPVL